MIIPSHKMWIAKKPFKKLGNILIHPLLLSFYVSLLIIFLFLPSFSRYKLEKVNVKRLFLGTKLIWEDLENDGVSDLINTSNSNVGTAGISVILYPSGHIDQWDIRGQFRFENDDFIFTGDYDGDGKKEIYAFTVSSDSIYLSCISDFHHRIFRFTNKFISTFGLVNGRSDIKIDAPHFIDVNHDGYKDLVFIINAGFSIYPRAYFIYDIKNDNVIKSPELGFYPSLGIEGDLIGNGQIEFVPEGYAPKNILDKIVKYHDSSSWLVMLNKDLEYVFPPVEFPGRDGSIIPFGYPLDSITKKLYLLWKMPPDQGNQLWLYQVNSKGNIVRQKKLTEISSELVVYNLFILLRKQKQMLAIPSSQGYIFCFDSLFNCIEKIDLNQSISNIFFMDVDLDKKKEIIIPDYEANTVTIFRNDFTNPAVIHDVKFGNPSRIRLTIKKMGHKASLLTICNDDMIYTLSYHSNPMFYGRFAIYASIWLAILLFTLIVRKTTRVQIVKRFNTEKKITELQLKIVKNQIDPHFTMNAINSVIAAIGQNEKEKAAEHLVRFSKMYRSLIISSDKIKRSLSDEIEFTRNYLELEKFRYHDTFTYSIAIHPEVDLEWEIPKMVILSPVENAVKHGLSNKSGDGRLLIDISLNDSKLFILIEDNGMGREATLRIGTQSTGKGEKIMNQFLELYEKITGIKIDSKIYDLYSPLGEPTGTKVVIGIPLKKNE
jgi:hypothetical protein